MLARILRLSERLGYLVAMLGAWTGSRVKFWLDELAHRLRQRHRDSALTESVYTESQVSSLSSLIVFLIIAVVGLIFWATSAQAQNSPVVRFFTIGSVLTPTPDSPPPPVEPPASGSSVLMTGGSIVFSMYAGAQQDLVALTASQSQPIRLTDHPADDRDPVWSPDGQRIAFSSRRDGNWELYVLDLLSGDISRLTYDLAYEGKPSWSPDGQWLSYEAYYAGNLDVYIIRADGSEGPYPVTHNPAPDYSPVWTTSPAGRELAYVSLREGNKDIYLISLDNPSETRAVNITNTPQLDEDQPTWSPDGMHLAYSADVMGISLVYTVAVPTDGAEPAVIGQGQAPAWSPDGTTLLFLAERAEGSLLITGQSGGWGATSQAAALPGFASSPDWTPGILPTVLQGSLASASAAPLRPAYEETLIVEPVAGSDSPYRLVNLQSLGVVADAPYLSDRVDASFSALRTHVNMAAGWDFLGQMDSVLWDLEQPVEPGRDYRNWHKAGRAFDIRQEYNTSQPPLIELVPEQNGPDLYWRLYVRCAIQDGSLGEPLRERPWDFTARFAGDTEAYENGGRLKEAVPSGYYVDFTRMAQIYGWVPVASDSSWRYNWPGVLYWQYEKRDGLDWWTAMSELYSSDVLEAAFASPAAPSELQASPPPVPTPTEAR